MHLVATLRSSSQSLRASVQHRLAAMSPEHQKIAAIAAGLAVAGVVALVTLIPPLPNPPIWRASLTMS